MLVAHAVQCAGAILTVRQALELHDGLEDGIRVVGVHTHTFDGLTHDRQSTMNY